jgi:hypothetical protein
VTEDENARTLMESPEIVGNDRVSMAGLMGRDFYLSESFRSSVKDDLAGSWANHPDVLRAKTYRRGERTVKIPDQNYFPESYMFYMKNVLRDDNKMGQLVPLRTEAKSPCVKVFFR